MKVGHMKFIDSLSFLPMALKKLPESFGFQDEIEKGHFPIYLNNQEMRIILENGQKLNIMILII